MMSLSLSWTYYRNRISPLIKFGLKIIILFKENNNLFKYCADVENCESFRDFSFIYIYR